MKKEALETEKSNTFELPEGVTQELLKGWKERYGEKKIKGALIPVDEDESSHISVILRVPDRNTMSQFEKFVDTNPKKSKEILINACVLSPNKNVIKEDDHLFATTANTITELMPFGKGEIKNI